MTERWRKRFLVGAFLALLLCTAAWTVRRAEPERAAFVQTPAQAKYVALTFDDGPKASTTGLLLDGLAERGAKATFFLIGCQAEHCPELVKRMAAEGHQLGVHTWSHVQLTGLNRAAFQREVGRTRACLTELVGPGDFMLRPPYGFADRNVKCWAGGPIICWSVDTQDWKNQNTEQIVQTISDSVADGAIILMHDIYGTSVEAALKSVDMLRAQGYYFVTVEELFRLRGIEPEAGKVYSNLP